MEFGEGRRPVAPRSRLRALCLCTVASLRSVATWRVGVGGVRLRAPTAPTPHAPTCVCDLFTCSCAPARFCQGLSAQRGRRFEVSEKRRLTTLAHARLTMRLTKRCADLLYQSINQSNVLLPVESAFVGVRAGQMAKPCGKERIGPCKCHELVCFDCAISVMVVLFNGAHRKGV